jgi:hypothetical protein
MQMSVSSVALPVNCFASSSQFLHRASATMARHVAASHLPGVETTIARIEPTCSVCGNVTASIVLSDSAEGPGLDIRSYGGTVSRTILKNERAALVIAAAELPYDAEKMWNAGVDEDAGYCFQNEGTD